MADDVLEIDVFYGGEFLMGFHEVLCFRVVRRDGEILFFHDLVIFFEEICGRY